MLPLCYTCGVNRARRLLDRPEVVFCSLRCAAEHGVGCVRTAVDYWCPACGVWHRGREACAKIPGRDLVEPRWDQRLVGRLGETRAVEGKEG